MQSLAPASSCCWSLPSDFAEHKHFQITGALHCSHRARTQANCHASAYCPNLLHYQATCNLPPSAQAFSANCASYAACTKTIIVPQRRQQITNKSKKHQSRGLYASTPEIYPTQVQRCNPHIIHQVTQKQTDKDERRRDSDCFEALLAITSASYSFCSIRDVENFRCVYFDNTLFLNLIRSTL